MSKPNVQYNYRSVEQNSSDNLKHFLCYWENKKKTLIYY